MARILLAAFGNQSRVRLAFHTAFVVAAAGNLAAEASVVLAGAGPGRPPWKPPCRCSRSADGLLRPGRQSARRWPFKLRPAARPRRGRFFLFPPHDQRDHVTQWTLKPGPDRRRLVP